MRKHVCDCATAMWLQILLTPKRRRTEQREVATMGVLADVRGDGEASVNDCKKYDQQFTVVFLVMATNAPKTIHLECMCVKKDS
jgi:hypothetical protein